MSGTGDYREGDEIPAWCDFTAADGGVVDPTQIYFTYQAPGASPIVVSVAGGGITMQTSKRATIGLPTYGYPGNWVGEWYVIQGGQHKTVSEWRAKVAARLLDMPNAVADPLPTDNTSGNPWAPYTVTTTDATATTLATLPMAAGDGVVLNVDLFARDLTTGDSGDWAGFGLVQRIGSAAPAGDATNGYAYRLLTTTNPITIPAAAVAAPLSTALAQVTATATALQIVVTGIAGKTIKWGLFGTWKYV